MIAPVAHAIAVVERLARSELIFDHASFSRDQGSCPAGVRAIDATTSTRRMRYYIDWINTYSAAASGGEPVPADPDGPIRLSRLRRTLAWFIYRCPGGRIALSVQYGHLRGYTSEGYGLRTRSGLRDVLPVEEARAAADTLHAAAERLRNGERVSGPAAERYLDGVSEFGRTFDGVYLTTRQAAALHANPKLRIHDNGVQPLACCYDATKALCHPGRIGRPSSPASTPDLTRCSPHCANIARTDSHVAAVKDEITHRRAQIDSPLTPEPIRERHRQRVTTLEAIVNRHEHDGRGAEQERTSPLEWPQQ